MKQVISVSLGSSKRDYHVKITCGQDIVLLERRGCNGRLELAADILRQLDGRVDVLGLGGVNIFYHLGSRRYPFPAGQFLVRQVRETPIVDGSGWKENIDTQAGRHLSFLPLDSKALVVSVLDRFWLAQSLVDAGFKVMVGDLVFGLKLPLLLSLPVFTKLAYLTMPAVRHLPLAYLYSPGTEVKNKQHHHHRLYGGIQIFAGDWHFIRRYLLAYLTGKVVITSGTNAADRHLLLQSGVTWLLTTTPSFNNINPAANAMEAVLVALGTKPSQYFEQARKLGWLPKLEHLQ